MSGQTIIVDTIIVSAPSAATPVVPPSAAQVAFTTPFSLTIAAAPQAAGEVSVGFEFVELVTVPPPYVYSPVWSVNGQIGAVELLPADLPGFTQSVQESLAASLQVQWSSVNDALVANGTIYFAFKTPYAGVIQSLDYFTGQGSFAVTIYINGTPVSGLNGVAVSRAAPSNAEALGANSFTVGQSITGVITAATGSPTNALLNLNVNWS